MRGGGGGGGARAAEPAIDTTRASEPGAGTTRIPLWLMIALAAPLLLIGASKSFVVPRTDVVAYRCYALAFLGGAHAVSAAHLTTCSTYVGTIPTRPFAILPREYGPLALLFFALAALAPGAFYPWLFAGEMLLVVFGITWLLTRTGAAGAAHAWLFYVMLGSMATAIARFDVVPAACVLLALVALRRNRQGWAYAALAAGVLLKFYPALLLPLFLIETWRSRGAIAGAWRGPAIFAGVVAAVEGAAALLAPGRVLDPLRFLGGRCVQVESLPATLAALWAWLTGGSLSYVNAYNSTCELAAGVNVVGTACTVLGAAGMVFVIWLFWRRRIMLAPAAILLLCISMLTSKVFSPQYLLWVSPLVAYAYGLRNTRIFALWGALCFATSIVFPLSYASIILVALRLATSDAVPVTAAFRNILFAVELIAVLWWAATHRRRMAVSTNAQLPVAAQEVLP
jgi:hypothetical protein